MSKRQPLAFVVEDDELHAMIITAVLKKFGIMVEVATTAKDFIERIKHLNPDLCFVDLNLESFGIGYTVIKAVRNVLGNDPVLIVLSGIADQKAIAHAMEIGANDFIVKPLDREILAAKISRFVTTDELLGAQVTLFPVPDGGSPATIDLKLRIIEVDEFGLKLIGKHLLTKGMVIYLDGSVVHEITGQARPQLLTVTSTWVETESQSYGAIVEFDYTDQKLMTAVRSWLSSQNIPTSLEKS